MRGARRRVKDRAKNARVSQSQQVAHSPSLRQILVLISALLALIVAGIGLYLAWTNISTSATPGSVIII